MIEAMLKRYAIETADDYHQALREIMQEIALAGLYRSNFFEKAAFYGGTALRIFYQLDRFSEDLDFSLLSADENFSLTPYFTAIKKEFSALGFDVEIKARIKQQKTAIQSAFLKSNTTIHTLDIKGFADSFSNRPIKIKFEVDTQPPAGFSTEEKLLLQPFSFYVKCYQPGDLFAGKLHALLYRSWKNRVKGRDWYDFEWYIRNQHAPHLSHFLQRAHQSDELLGRGKITITEVKELLLQRIKVIDFDQAKQDIFPFIQQKNSLDIWSEKYFSDLVLKMSSYC
ncbi:MAG TPA: nucleotidyl transferase AbiEii/AbiGii toxin family protein [Gammaproteobacteria bacterium]|nr:nucleotidyl transferase AbiEii/AbiGii toxin family protein [Gammaproteobacteria bacterium]